MASFTRKTAANLEKLAEAPKSGNSIPTSGIYDVTLKCATLDLSPWGTRNVGLFLEVDGNPRMMYSVLDLGPEDTTGLESWKVESYDRAWAVFDHMCVVCGIDPNDLAETETVSLPIGKEKAMKDVEAFTEFEDKEIKAWFKFEYYKSKDGDIKEKIVLKETFTSTGLSGDEVLREETEPTRIEKLEKYVSAVAYKSELTEEDVKAWIEGGRKSGGGTAPSAPTKTPSFGKKTFGKK
jgi:hypothetical protein